MMIKKKIINILVTGANGQLGSEFRSLEDSCECVRFFLTDIPEMDITDQESVDKYVLSKDIDVIINCAAYTQVDRAEEDAVVAEQINAIGPEILARVACAHDLTLVHISTDYVFDGTTCLPYCEDHPTSPLGVYGRTKLEGEERIQQSGCKSIILRTSWLYSSFGNNFVKTMLRLGSEREELRVIFDQVGTPTYARDLAETIVHILPDCIEHPRYGEVYHFSNEGVCSWYDFATTVIKKARFDCVVYPIETKEYPTAAKRPHYSVLNKRKIKRDFGVTIPHWEASLIKCLERL